MCSHIGAHMQMCVSLFDINILVLLPLTSWCSVIVILMTVLTFLTAVVARVTLTLDSCLPHIPKSLPSTSGGISCSQFSPIYSNQAQHTHMHMIHISNTHATFKGRVKKYDEIQANSLGWLNPSCSSWLKLGRSWPVSCLCRDNIDQFTF